MSIAWLEFLAKHIVPDMKSALKLSHVLSTRELLEHMA
jgi:hypothetical protein